MKAIKALIYLVILASLAYGAYTYRAEVVPFVSEIYGRITSLFIKPCSQPLTYRIGHIDSGFGISKDFVVSALKDAEAIWEKPFGRDLFKYDAGSGFMDVNMVYDYRQEASSKLKSLGVSVDSNKATYDSLKVRYDSLKNLYAQQKAAYDAAYAKFEAENKAYQETVDYWNKKGGAPKQQYEAIETERTKLQSDLAALKSQQAALNSMVDEINALAVTINQLANSLNLTVEKYNTVGETLGDSFEEGLYHTDGYSKTIDIYEFKDRASLVRVLAHELGHALDLDHVTDPKAIMYSYNQSTNIVLTDADMSELKQKCGVK